MAWLRMMPSRQLLISFVSSVGVVGGCESGVGEEGPGQVGVLC